MNMGYQQTSQKLADFSLHWLAGKAGFVFRIKLVICPSQFAPVCYNTVLGT
jgi:hypothetical protein